MDTFEAQNAFIMRIMKLGVVVCGLLVLFGLLADLMTARALFSADAVNHLISGDLLPYSSQVSAAFLSPAWFIKAGVAMLIALPIVRIAAYIVVFAAQKDKSFLAVTVLVFVIMIVGLFSGKIL